MCVRGCVNLSESEEERMGAGTKSEANVCKAEIVCVRLHVCVSFLVWTNFVSVPFKERFGG